MFCGHTTLVPRRHPARMFALHSRGLLPTAGGPRPPATRNFRSEGLRVLLGEAACHHGLAIIEAKQA